jgi:drug/metabolite transporter (DMT)-like permease
MNIIKKFRNYNEKELVDIKKIAAFIVIYFVWGSTYLAIRLAIETVPPFIMMGTRFFIAGIIIYSWCYYRSKIKPDKTDWKRACVTGLFMIFCGYACLVWAQQYISSGLAAVLVATLPIWMVILDWIQTKNGHPNKFTLIGICIGITGVALLYGIDKEVLIRPARFDGLVILSSVAITVGSIMWAAGSIYIKGIKTSISVIYFAGLQLLIGGFLLIIFGLLQGEWQLISFVKISLLSIISLCYLIVMGSLVAYSSYIWLLKVSTPTKVGTYAFFNPLIAVILGCILLNEPITIRMAIGSFFILISIFFITQPEVINRSYSMTRNLKSEKSIIKNIKEIM